MQDTTTNFKVTDDMSADWCLRKIKEVQEEGKRVTSVIEKTIDEYKAKLEAELKSVESNVEYFRGLLEGYVRENDLKLKETKTQASYKLATGSIVVKKDSLQIGYDKAKLLDYAKEYGLDEYVKTKEEFDWASFKKGLEPTELGIVNKSTGEILDVEGLSVESVPGMVTFKLD